MKGPVHLIRSGQLEGLEHLGPLHAWSEGAAYLMIDRIGFRAKQGVVLCYFNPPVHQVGNPALDAYLEGMDKILVMRGELQFLVLCGANDPVHAGGDLKESLDNLDRTLALKEEKERAGAPEEEIDRLFDWAHARLQKGFALHGKIRRIAQSLRVVALCGGGTRFGGSAEIPLMADILVGDSRSAMCFSESMIGLIPGWSGIARALIKAGPVNTAYMTMTGSEVKAPELLGAGIYNVVVDVSLPFPGRQRTGDPEGDKKEYLSALEDHDKETGRILIPRALEIATCPDREIPVKGDGERSCFGTMEEISAQVARRRDPRNYAHLWGRPLKEVRDQIREMGRPLAPQSVAALEALLEGYDPATFDETRFVRREMEADAGLYRDPRFRAGLVATLDQKVADYREVT